MSARRCWAGLLSLSVALGAGCAGAAETVELPRRTTPPAPQDESYPGVDVIYDAIRDAAGERLRLIVTHPHAGGPRFATIFVVGWLSCDTVEAPEGTKDEAGQVFRAIAQIPGFATVRMDKPGIGDSEGDCAKTDFEAELAAYRQAFRKMRTYPFVDPDRIFVFGLSNGGGFAPLVADGAPVRGYVTVGGWVKTWYEHMLEIERRRLTLEGRAPGEINALMKDVERLYSAYLLERQRPGQILQQSPQLRARWEGDPDQLYGRPVAYYQQLQDLNLMAAWSEVRVPLLALWGEFDWIMSRQDIELIVGLVNRNAPGAAQFVVLPEAGHTFQHFASLQDSFAWKNLPFDPRSARRVVDWFEQHR